MPIIGGREEVKGRKQEKEGILLQQNAAGWMTDVEGVVELEKKQNWKQTWHCFAASRVKIRASKNYQ